MSPNTISLPKGPGSIEGLGESFQPTLNTGTAKYGLGIKLPPGTAGHQPSLSLSYDGGGANGPLGYGWSLSLPHIQRQTDKGIPTYGEFLGVNRPDKFITEAREELVPLADGFWFCENEASFIRYRFVPHDADPASFLGHWEAHLPNGTKLEFGLTSAGRIEDAVTGHIFNWLLERQTDTRDNVIEYVYRPFPGGLNLNQKYLSLVRYGPGAPPWAAHHFVAFEYEDRTDWFEDGRAGFLIRTGKRLKSVLVGTEGVELSGHLAGDFSGDSVPDHLNRRYDLGYLDYAGAESHWSLLAQIKLTGADGVTALPAVTFDYAVSNPPEFIDASGNVWGALDEPSAVMDNALVDLIDLNADGLPDILKTDSGGGAHTVAVNRGPAAGEAPPAIQWAPPVEVDPSGDAAWNFDLGSERTHLADMDGDGLADLVHKTADGTVFFFANKGTLNWGDRRDMVQNGTAPPAPFGSLDLRTADVDFDKRIDIIQSIDLGSGVAYRTWFNVGNQSYSAPFTIEPEGGFDFTLPGVQVADCNGDRVPDVARVQPGSVNVSAGLGYGRFAPTLGLLLPDYTLDEQQVGAAKLTDINGDGLSDLVLERAVPGQCWYWLNLGNYTLSARKVLTGLPTVSSGAAVRWADLNGNGTADLVYGDSLETPRIQMVELGQLVSGGLAPNLLKSIRNGIGRITTIEYEPSTKFAQQDAAAGNPWPDALPFPVTVVSAVRISDSLGHEYLTQFRYHDGFYDPVEKQFRGFADVEQVEVGDSTAPTLVSRSTFDTGRSYDAMKGRLLAVSAETESGQVFSRDTTTWADPPRLLHTGTNQISVRFAHPVASVKEILELDVGTPRRLESELEFDNYGNETRVSSFGIVEDGDRFAFDDERVMVTDYALNLPKWIVRQPKQQVIQDEHGVLISKSEMFYDDDTFGGENLGEVTLGNLTLRRDWIDPANPASFVNSARTRYDTFGNPVALLDPLANGTGNPALGHFRELEYDEHFHCYPEREKIHVGGGNPELVFTATYDEGLATVLSSTDFNQHTTTYGYDALGRLTRMVRPGDNEAYPTTEYEYVLGLTFPCPYDGTGVINYVETRQRDRSEVSGSKPEMYLYRRQFSDGLGRGLMTRSEAEPAEGGSEPRVVVSGVTLYNARLQPAHTFNPFFTTQTGTLDELLAFEDVEASGWQGLFHEAGSLVALDLDAAHQSATEYDAMLRPIKAINPDGSFGRTEFEPLMTRSFDENDADPVSPHFGTPMVNFTDGLGRLIEVNEVVRMNDNGTPSGALNTWITRYTYDLNDRLIRIIDSQNNVKEMRYDGLQRKVWMNDPDAGISTNVYDAGSNLIETTDAKGQRITYTYDGVNRILTEDYHDENSPEFSYGRTPDVVFHYDDPAGPVDQGDGTVALARNVRGKLAWVADNTGEEHTSHDERGRTEWTVKRIMDPVLSSSLNPDISVLVAYKTVFDYDPIDRVTRMVYPDNDEVSYKYNDRSLLAGIIGGPSGHILSGLAYLPSAQQDQIDYGNGVRTEYEYDSRLRLRKLDTHHPVLATQLIQFTYDLDPVSNIRSITDQRPISEVPADDPRRNTQLFQYDDLYRLTQVRYNLPNPGTGNGGEINYRYDRIGNLLAQTSDLQQAERGVSVTDLGDLHYGGALGRMGRAGRSPGDPPGPHALTSIDDPQSAARSFPYDANGNMKEIDGLQCAWDFRDRLVAVEDDTMRAEYRYDFTGRRIIKRVHWKQGEPAAGGQSTSPAAEPSTTSTTYPGLHFEVREHDQPVKYVFSGGTRVARITSSLSTSSRVQRFRLRAGWNLCAVALNRAPFPPSSEIESRFRWDPESRTWVEIADEIELDAGAIVWLRATTDTLLALIGDYTPPVNQTLAAGATFVSGGGLEVIPLLDETGRLTMEAMLSTYDTADQSWRIHLASIPISDPALPKVLAPGTALFVNSAAPFELEMPDPALRIRYYHHDHLGSPSLMTDMDGTLLKEIAFFPFGEPRNEYRLRQIEEDYKFTQKERDRESGLNYFEARYLAGTLSRFVSADLLSANPGSLSRDAFVALTSNPQKLNLYSYALNCPVKYVDPSGYWELDYGGEGAPDQHTIVEAYKDPDAGRVGMVLKEAACVPVRLLLDSVNAVLGTSPANAPGPGDKTYPSVSTAAHIKDAAITLGGGKVIKWAGGRLFGRGAQVEANASFGSVRVGSERTASGVVQGGGGVAARTALPEELAHTVPNGTMVTGMPSPATRASMQQTMKEMYADPVWGPHLRKMDATRAERMTVETTDRAKAVDMLGKMIKEDFSPKK